MENPSDPVRDLHLLEQIEHDPDVTQASLATQLGVAVGTINWHIKRLIAKGYVKVKRAERRKLKYIITPEGIAFRAHLTVDYVQQSFLLYRNIRVRTKTLLDEARLHGYENIRIDGDGDVAEICRLTCLEQDIPVVEDGGAPVIEVRGLHIHLRLKDRDLISE